MNEKCQTLGSHRGGKMELKSIKNLIKNGMNFESDFETTFSRSWVEVGAKNLSEMRGLRVIFSTSLRRCEKYDFEQPSNVFPMFFDFEGLDFGAERVDFSVVFSKALWRGTFFNFGSNSGPNGSPNGSQNRRKNQLNFKLNF